jgi:HEAT repeat protein
MAKLAEHSQFPPISSVWRRWCTFQAELRAVIEHHIPQLLQLLKDDNTDVRVAAANVMAKLAEYSEFPRISSVWRRWCTVQAELRSAIESVIPQLLRLLQDDSEDIRGASATVMVKLAGSSEFRKDSEAQYRWHLFQAELRVVVKNAVPQLLQLFENGRWGVRDTGANLMANLAEHGEFPRSSSFLASLM